MAKVDDRVGALRTWQQRCPLREWRRKHDLTQKETAGMLGVSLATLQNWEYGVNAPSERMMAKIRELIGTHAVRTWLTWFAERPQAVA